MSVDYNYNLEILDNTVMLIHYPIYMYEKVMFNILKSTLLPYTSSKFFSLTCNEDEISLFVDEELKPSLLENEIIDCNYKVIKIYDTSDGIDNIGVVSKISSIFSKHNIPILYINSFNNNYILVKLDNLELAKDCLIKEGFL